MRYKTIVLELLEEYPETYDRLRRGRLLLPTLERYARELKSGHEAWKARLCRAHPGRSEIQVSGEALEMALKDLEDSLRPGHPPEGMEPPAAGAEGAVRPVHGRGA
jgi:hypothetical protein